MMGWNAPIRKLTKAVLPEATHRWISTQRRRLSCRPPVGWVQFGSLRRLEPVSRTFGLDRGASIDRYYIEKFLARHALDIQGCVLEIANNEYTSRFGGGRVTTSHVLHVQEGNPKATVVADLASENGIAANSFDCIILTQTLQFIYDVRAAILNLHRILKPGGILLATVPGISQISRYDVERWGEYWRFTTLSVQKLFEQRFSANQIMVEAFGNVLTANAFLQGLAVEELRPHELDYKDADFQLLITVRAEKSESQA